MRKKPTKETKPQLNLVTTCQKRFENFPFAHRQHTHDGHCALIHGHNWAFVITFAAQKFDENRFVIDFGKLQWVKKWLTDHFDHTLVLNESDPHREYLQSVLIKSPDGDQSIPAPQITFAKIVVVPNGGAEGLAAYVLHHLNVGLTELGIGQDRGLYVQRVTVEEDSKNSATVELR